MSETTTLINLQKRIKGDKVIWAIVFILSVFSLLAVYSSIGTLAYRYKEGNTYYYLFKHLFILLFGIFLMYATHLIKYTYYSRLSQLLLIITIPLQLLTLFTGTNLNEASRWLTLPIINLSFQTSDLAKLALIMYVARLLSKKQDEIKDFKSAFIPIMLPVLIVCGLIFPANFSTAAILFATCFILMFIGRVNIKYLLAFMGIGLVIISIALAIAFKYPHVLPRFETWKNRIENFKSGETNNNYQVEQAKIAIATGGVFGKLPGKSIQRNFLPHPYSDFIFAIIIEEYGLAGGMLIVFLYVILLFRAIKIASKCDKVFPALLVVGCALILIFQAFINMAVAVNILPVTGQTLPMVSMGGTSIWFTSISIGIMLSVSKSYEIEDKTEEEEIEK
ncbi:MAG: FtsW/RodA/SpoVE family cell cycle protein [Bacteroidales bacterium]|jgi:cell division protein FtsW